MFFKKDDTLDKLNIDTISTQNVEQQKKQKIVYRDIGSFTSKLNQDTSFKIYKSPIFVIPICFILFALYKFSFPTNPLIGEWRPAQKTIINMGKLEFTKERMIMVGMTDKIQYEVLSNKVIVKDSTGTGLVFNIINNNTIHSAMFGKYIRVK